MIYILDEMTSFKTNALRWAGCNASGAYGVLNNWYIYVHQYVYITKHLDKNSFLRPDGHKI